MSEERVREFIRRFAENRLKLLLENPDNVRELLTLVAAHMARGIDFRRMEVLGATFIQRDYRHVESDVVLTAPLHPEGRRSRPNVLVYILIEHQSEPDELMPLRMLEYVVAIYKSQLRKWAEGRTSLRGARLQPVLPVLFYTGTRRWDSVGSLGDLIEEGERFAEVTPVLRPLFLNLDATDPDTLTAKGGAFGQVLRLLRERRARSREFRGVLREVVERLEAMPDEEKLRWKDLLSYIQALVYHEREVPEQQGLLEVVQTSAQTEEHRQEISAMRQTGAQALMEEGAIQGRREMLLLQLHERFGDVPADIVATVETTKSRELLQEWAKRFVTAEKIEEVGIAPPSERPRKRKR